MKHRGAVEAVLSAILDGRGELAGPVKRAAAGLDGADESAVPEAARGLIDKVRHAAYKIVDADVAAVRAAGVSEPALFELSVAAAVGQGVRRYRAGMAALAAAKAMPGASKKGAA